ncbi:MAG: RluA family pseudouridine synthase [Planctomycetota bacterium]
MSGPSAIPEPNERVRFALRHEDAHLVVVDKPSRLVTQPGKGHERDTLVNGVMAHWGRELTNLGASRDFGLLHRLDKETSGLVIVARTPSAYDAMREAFEQRRVEKFYYALTNKAPNDESGVIRLPLDEQVERTGRYTSVRTGRVVRGNSGKPALTAYRVLARSDLGALIEARPVTGRLHQVRLHLDAIGATVLGDPAYGPRAARLSSSRLALHAHRLRFVHPATDEMTEVRSAMPKELRSLMRRLDLPVEALHGSAGSGDPGHEAGGKTVGDEEA